MTSELPRTLSILVVDDDASVCASIKAMLEEENYQVQVSSSAAAGLDALNQGSFDIVLCDFALPGVDGLQFVKAARQSYPDCVVVLMTAFGNLELAVKAIRAGAYDYLPKPFSGETLLLTIKKIEEREALKAENQDLKQQINQRYSFGNLVAHSQAMKDILETVKRLANYNTTVLINGESGTGKEMVARALHCNSPRRGKPFIPINCAAIPEHLIESELFGHKRGAFTDANRDKKGLLEQASGGTVFLDEIGELPAHLQVKLLRALQEQKIRRVGDEELIEIDTRILAATLRNLEEDVKTGRFRDDLFYRLNVISIFIPPLRERPEDVPIFIQHFLEKHTQRLGIDISEISPEAMKCMLAYSWPGNVRELENCMERALVLSSSGKIDLDSLPSSVQAASSAGNTNPRLMTRIPDDNLSIKAHTRALEAHLIQRALTQTEGNRTHAAKILDISHRALLYKLKEYGIK